ncbi:MAG: discoidin domain-containing protein [Leptospiraceae bacterium]|nr:discoidin domain-containing protein [Leptospiraceae bacterium]
MTAVTRISHPQVIDFTHWSAPGQSEFEKGRLLNWTGEESERPELIACVATFDGPRSFNSISIARHQDLPRLFPETFRFEISIDGHIWEPLLQESSFSNSGKKEHQWHFTLVHARYIKFLFLQNHKSQNGKYQAAFGGFQARISGITTIEVSSELDRLWVKENLIDERPDYGWSSALRNSKKPEFIALDLGSVNQVAEIRALTPPGPIALFPERFSFSYSEDNIAWHHLMEENAFLSEGGTWYQWRFMPTNMRFIRLEITEGARNLEGRYISQIVELEFFAIAGLQTVVQERQSISIQHASVLRSGLVRLAMDGEDREGVVVQGHDRRLHDATTEARGIVELAVDGEDREGVVIQAHDRRLKPATEDLPGIVRFARSGEERAGYAVQGHDERLKRATTEAPGLVELANDSEDRAGAVVQGNDSRIKGATTRRAGIVRLSENLGTNPSEVVQANDNRLRQGSTEYPGIVQLSLHGQNVKSRVVQADDPRLAPASPENTGVVKLGRSGENRPGFAVAADDARLQKADVGKAGVIALAAAGSELAGCAVQADDPRLKDKRQPLPHDHDYATREHDINSHAGQLRARASLDKAQGGLDAPWVQASVLSAENEGSGIGLLGQGGDGVCGLGEAAGILGLNPGEGDGVLGLSRQGTGGRFVSERGIALWAGGDYAGRNMASGRVGLRVSGQAQAEGALWSGLAGAACVAIVYKVDKGSVLSAGDLVVAHKSGDYLVKSDRAGAAAVVGVVVDEAALVLQATRGGAKYASGGELLLTDGYKLIAIQGFVELRVVNEKGKELLPGDLLVASSNAGYAERLNADRYRPGSLVARCLSPCKQREGKVLAQLL